MKNYIQPGDSITVAAPTGGTVSGGLYKVGAIIGVAANTVDAGELVVLKTTGVFDLQKVAAQEWGLGDPIYMNTTSRYATNEGTAGQVLIGVAVAEAANPSSHGRVRLNGVSAPEPVAAAAGA